MLRQLIFGGAVSLGNIAVHAAMMLVIVRSRGTIHANVPTHPALRLVGIMIATVSMLMVAHIARGRDLGDGLFARGSDFARHRESVFRLRQLHDTRLWRHHSGGALAACLAPLTAMNGVLLFGWSTAVIYHVLRASIPVDEPNRR